MLAPTDAMVRGFLRAAAWTATEEDGEPLLDENAIHYCDADFDDDARDKATDLCARFLRACEGMLDDPTHRSGVGIDSEQGGHDLWLTVQRHGAGFWDGDWSHGEELTDAVHTLSPSAEFWHVYVNNEGGLSID
jgi:hypothetical protein